MVDCKQRRKTVSTFIWKRNDPQKLNVKAFVSLIVPLFVTAELVTRLSSVCCEDVARCGALRVIYALVRKCNRSLPHMEIIKHSLCILINVSKVRSYETSLDSLHSRKVFQFTKILKLVIIGN